MIAANQWLQLANRNWVRRKDVIAVVIREFNGWHIVTLYVTGGHTLNDSSYAKAGEADARMTAILAELNGGAVC